MSLERGSIILVPFPFTDLSDYKIRPALVINNLHPEQDIIVVFITSVIYKPLKPTDFQINKSDAFFQETGLKVDSIAKCNKLATISKNIIFGRIGNLSEKIMIQEIDARLKIALAIN